MRRLRPWLAPLFLLGLCVLAYGLWVPRMGWYWDDFPIGWIARTYGSAGLERYFSTNRPVWGLLYRLTTPLLGTHPLAWQVFAIFWRWMTGLALWWLLRLAWPKRADFAVWASALFLIYPGFSQQFISLVYSHFFIVLTAFLASLAFTLQALRSPRYFWPLTALAWLLGLFNLLCMEYFFFLELVRPVLVWIVLSGEKRGRRTLLTWLPYLASLAGVIVWRTFFFSSGLYQPVFPSLLRANPLGALLHLAGRMVNDAWLTTVLVWQNAFRLPTSEELTPNLMRIFWGVVISGSVLALGYAWLSHRVGDQQGASFHEDTRPLKGWFPAPLLVGLFCLAVSGAPYWLTNLPLSLTFHFDRFNLSFMLGAVLVAVGLLFLAPLPRWVRVIPLALALGFCAGYQYQQAIIYVRDWNVQQRLMWQLAWRMPGVQPGTVFMSNELPVKHYSDNSLSAALNWVFAPQNHTQDMLTMLLYPTVRLGNDLPALQPGLSLDVNYLAARFRSTTSQTVVFYYKPPGCVRVLDPVVERDNYTLPRYLRRAMILSTTAPILAEGQLELPHVLFGTQSEGSWCYYFEKADLARQQGDWQQVIALGEKGFASGDYPNDPVERFPFIEAYAHSGDWARALEQSRLAADVAPVYEIVVCRLWERIEHDLPSSPERDGTLRTIQTDYRCDQPRTEPKPDKKSEEMP
jgi:hypothetical protein